jgi:hypothetical protein
MIKSHLVGMRGGVVLLLIATTGAPTLAVGIDWVEALRAYYTAEVVYERCNLFPTWDQRTELNQSIADAERESLLPSVERIAMKAAIEVEAELSESQFCAENGRWLFFPKHPE